MRVVGGRLKGRALKGPASDAIRPTSDRLRESLFNILLHSYGDPVEGARVLDLFAGTGAMGIEALSRGARFALFVDPAAEACAVIRANIEGMGLGDMSQVLRRDAARIGVASGEDRFTLAFLDPPYGKGLAPRALKALRDGGWLDKDALVIVEETAEAELPLPEGFATIEARRYSETQVQFIRAK